MITVERKVRFGQARGRWKKAQEGSGDCRDAHGPRTSCGPAHGVGNPV